MPLLLLLLATTDLLASRMIMEKKMLPSLPQLAKIASILLLFLLAPLVPSSLRPPYLYLLFNTLVVVLGVEAGFLCSGPRDGKKQPPPTPSSTTGAASPNLTKPSDNVVVTDSHLVSGTTVTPTLPDSLNLKEVKPADAVVKDVVGAAKKQKKKIKKCPSRASIFFIGSVDADGWEDVDATVHEEKEEEGKDAGELIMSKQELFTKAEAFIGNFYKQLKMQREESWKKLQDLYYHHHYKAKAF